MLITFEATDHDLDQGDPIQMERLFTELLRASINGFHFVIIKNSMCEWAKNNLILNGREIAHLKYLQQSFTQYGALLRAAPSKMSITVGDHAPTSRRTCDY